MMYTRSLTCTGVGERELQPGAFYLLLTGWFSRHKECCCWRRSRSDKAICELVNWSHWSHISRADNPLLRIQLLRLAVATAKVSREIGPPSGQMRRSSSPSSATHFSATGFLLGFLTRPTSTTKPYCRRVASLAKEAKPGAGSTLMTEGGAARGRSSSNSRRRLERIDSRRSSSRRHEAVKEVTVSQTTSISWR